MLFRSAVGRVRSRLDRAVADGANLLVLRIDSAGGAPEQSLVLASWLAGLDPAVERTVAWVPREARGDAALVAAACDEIVMGPDATLGGEGAASLADRIGHMLSGVSAPVAIKVFGPDLDKLRQLGIEIQAVAKTIPGFEDVKLDQQSVIPQLRIEANRERCAAGQI